MRSRNGAIRGGAAALLGVTKSYLYQNHTELPFTVKLSAGRLRFSHLGVQKYLSQKKG